MVAIRLACIPHTWVWKIIFNRDIQRKISISDFSWKKKMGWSEKSGPSASSWGLGGGRGRAELGAVVSPGHPELVKWPSVPGGVGRPAFSTSGMMLRYQVCIRERMDLSVCILLWETVNSKARDRVAFILVNPWCFTDVNWKEALPGQMNLKVACRMLKGGCWMSEKLGSNHRLVLRT